MSAHTHVGAPVHDDLRLRHHAFIARIRDGYPFMANPREVASIFSTPLAEPRSSAAARILRTLSDGTEREVSAFLVGAHVIWGATEAIAREILRAVL